MSIYEIEKHFGKNTSGKSFDKVVSIIFTRKYHYAHLADLENNEYHKKCF